jgi:hypothetical protein
VELESKVTEIIVKKMHQAKQQQQQQQAPSAQQVSTLKANGTSQNQRTTQQHRNSTHNISNQS